MIDQFLTELDGPNLDWQQDDYEVFDENDYRAELIVEN
jgi:hypothetical protein